MFGRVYGMCIRLDMGSVGARFSYGVCFAERTVVVKA